MEKTKGRGHMEIIFPVILFMVFTLCALFIILFAARTYQHIIEESDTRYNESTSMAYITRKIRSMDEGGSVTTGSFAGCDALVMKTDINGAPYVTYIYAYGGYLRELFTAEEGSSVSPESGMILFEAGSFTPSMVGESLIKLSITTLQGREYTGLVALNSKEAL